ncbi:cytochrome P450 [Mycena pura]|uniref:Cytochrome P450 n=1 Tax=Mycena pura TaxID=153505 RepID=A0AAD6UVX6_9AGAR|nr:cytochrome P450 [Mycena pura]
MLLPYFDLWGPGVGVVVACSLYVLVLYFYDSYGIRKYPGPFTAKFSYAWIIWVGITGRRSQKIHDAHNRYGPIIRISPCEISFSDPAVYPVIHSFNSKAAKSSFYDSFGAIGLRNVFTTRSKTDHGQKRRLLQSLFTVQVAREFTPRTSSIMTRLIDKWESRYISSKTGFIWFDCAPWITLLAFDFIGEFIFGESFGMIESGLDSVTVPNDLQFPFVIGKATDVQHCQVQTMSLTHLVSMRERYNYPLGLLPKWWRPVGRRVLRKEVQAAKTFSAFVAYRFAQRLSTTAPHSQDTRDLVGRFLHKSKVQNEEFKPESLVADLITILVAGSDTTRNSLIAALHYLAKSQNAQHDLQAELDSHMISHVTNYTDIEGLPYLNACLNETLRLYSPVGIGLPRTVPHPGMSISGAWVAGGTTVGVPIYTVHRNEALWGEHPEEFRPGRWLQGDGAQGLDADALKAFSDGPMRCIGRHLALAQLRVMIASIFIRFDVALEDPENPLHIEEWFVRKATKCRIGLRRRRALSPDISAGIH